MLPIHLAPIQGQTDLTYRKLHSQLIGGVDRYYTPFVRWEKDGLRKKDLRDIDMTENTPNTAVQIIFKDREEFMKLTERVMEEGWKRIDLNMGCPFPLQTHAGRGAGILQHTDVIEQIINEMATINEVVFSIKMRSGMERIEEGLRVMEILNSARLEQITLHPRLGRQQYKGRADRETYGLFLKTSTHPMVYNGDISTPEEMEEIEKIYPKTAGLMIGRGLLSRPTLAKEYREGERLTREEQLRAVVSLHEGVYDHASKNLQGEAQILAKLQTFWEPMEDIIEKKIFKSLTRCGKLRNYREAVAALKKSINY